MPALAPAAEHVLDVAVRRARSLIRDGNLTDAVRTLAIGGFAADLVHDQEIERVAVVTKGLYMPPSPRAL